MTLISDYPWITPSKPLIVSAPMMKIALGHYAVATSAAGGIGFLAGGFDMSTLQTYLAEADALVKERQYPNIDYHQGLLPLGVGVQNWGADLDLFIDAIKAYPVAAVWFFAPKKIADLDKWTKAVRKCNPMTKVWIQLGTVAEALEAVKLVKPDVLVVQGADAGGHGLAQRASIITLLPEIRDMLLREDISIPLIAAGGIMDGRGTAAALALGADGVCMGTRFLACSEAVIARGYQHEILRASDGGVSTVGSTVYDTARGIYGWPREYNGRGIINRSYMDAQRGVSLEDIGKLYTLEVKKGDEGWGPAGRMTTYAGTGVGLVKEVLSIQQIVKSVQNEAAVILRRQADACRL